MSREEKESRSDKKPPEIQMARVNGNSNGDGGERFYVCIFQSSATWKKIQVDLDAYKHQRPPSRSTETNNHKKNQVEDLQALFVKPVGILVTNNPYKKYAAKYKDRCKNTLVLVQEKSDGSDSTTAIEVTKESAIVVFQSLCKDYGATPINVLHEKLNKLIIKEVEFQPNHFLAGKLLSIMLEIQCMLMDSVMAAGHVGIFEEMYWRCDHRKRDLISSGILTVKRVLMNMPPYILMRFLAGYPEVSVISRRQLETIPSALRNWLKDEALSNEDEATAVAWGLCYAKIAGKLSLQGRDLGKWLTFCEGFRKRFGDKGVDQLVASYNLGCRLAEEKAQAQGGSDSSAGAEGEAKEQGVGEVEMEGISLLLRNREKPVNLGELRATGKKKNKKKMASTFNAQQPEIPRAAP